MKNKTLSFQYLGSKEKGELINKRHLMFNLEMDMAKRKIHY